MKYLESFMLASEDDEVDYILGFGRRLGKMDMQCYSRTNVYPFKIFPDKGLDRLDFEPITVLYGGNGSGKSTILNLIAEKLRLERSAPFNNTPFIEEYLKYCKFEMTFGRSVPRESKIVTSDGVFDSLLDVRAINEGVDRRREELFAEYESLRGEEFLLRNFDDLDEFKRRNEAKRSTKSSYVSKRLSKEIDGMSNGETAYFYFTKEIGEMPFISSTSPKSACRERFRISFVSL